jgi:hypothetical protein
MAFGIIGARVKMSRFGEVGVGSLYSWSEVLNVSLTIDERQAISKPLPQPCFQCPTLNWNRGRVRCSCVLSLLLWIFLVRTIIISMFSGKLASSEIENKVVDKTPDPGYQSDSMLHIIHV